MFLMLFSVVFMFMLGLNPVSVGKFIGSQFGLAVGMSTGVVENPMNKLALDLKQKEDGLNARKKELDAREAWIDDSNNRRDSLILFMGLGIWVLFCLIMINFYMDIKKRKKIRLEMKNNVRVGRESIKI